MAAAIRAELLFLTMSASRPSASTPPSHGSAIAKSGTATAEPHRPEEAHVGAGHHIQQKMAHGSRPGRQQKRSIATVLRLKPDERCCQRRTRDRADEGVRASLVPAQINVPSDRHEHRIEIRRQRPEHACGNRSRTKSAATVERDKRAAEGHVRNRIHALQIIAGVRSRSPQEIRRSGGVDLWIGRVGLTQSQSATDKHGTTQIGSVAREARGPPGTLSTGRPVSFRGQSDPLLILLAS